MATRVEMKTSMGSMTVEFDEEKAPVTVENFVAYANDGFFDGTIFHRVINGFMIQGGGMNPDLSQKENKDPIVNETNNGLKNHQGMTDAFERFQTHLDANEIDISKEKATLGPLLTMDPDTEEFTGPNADEANKMLTKKYRKGFVIKGAETL